MFFSYFRIFSSVINGTISSSKSGWIFVHYWLHLQCKRRYWSGFGRIFFMLINNQTKIKIDGCSTRINFTTLQLPESRFIIPGKYQYLIEAPGYYSKAIISPLSAYIPIPGMLAKAFCLPLLNFLVTKSFERVNNFNFIKAFTSGNA